ncbi:GNAT family N-acetyltransferase [Tsukamurella pseudospumae]|uniref:Acetyltransferase n=1 Tax=Tsukamurella pseudospumae TaxID=239498 RepID=A0A137ZLV4_9ACTN|nr:N-acetyltransferase [Tsukamurella pseudospumae]KXO99172.1 acetyltransferase [Tsukamurella pseudospumae]
MLVRNETADDRAAVADVHRSAFAPMTPPGRTEPVEVVLVEALRLCGAWIDELSFVAEDDDGAVVAHICLTRATVGDVPALALGPLGVRADVQARGTGSALMLASLGAADALGEPLVALLGHKDYYPRFGFVPAADLGVTPDVAEWAGDSFMVRTLGAYRPELRGEFRYPSPFYLL